MPSTLVLVLGDSGRSPRMQYHCLSLLDNNHDVTYLGYAGTPILDSLQSHSKLNEVRVQPLNLNWSRPFKPLYYILRALTLILQILIYARGKYDLILLQNPPSLPTLFLAYILIYIYGNKRKAEVIVDWHNLGYTMFKEENWFIRKIVRVYESFFGRLLSTNSNGFCVSEGMKEWLGLNFGVLNVEVLHDRPPSFFKPTSLLDKHELFERIGLKGFTEKKWLSNNKLDIEKTKIVEVTNRPKLIISSTSWTPDEDFSILFNALQNLDNSLKNAHNPDNFPNILCIVTGKGPQKEFYEEKIGRMKMEKVEVRTIWLESGDYPILVGSADLGISLHTSTSGIDLPMKVVDMFGGGVPVLAVDFKCLSELVKDGKNGRVFKGEKELEDILRSVLGEEKVLNRLRKGVGETVRWEENWNNVALPVINSALEKRSSKPKNELRWKGTGLMIFAGMVFGVYLNY